jgi:hypothetical protein
LLHDLNNADSNLYNLHLLMIDDTRPNETETWYLIARAPQDHPVPTAKIL